MGPVFFFLLGTRKGREKSLPKEMKESLEVDGSAAKDGAESVVAKARDPSPMTTISQRIFGHDKTGKKFTGAEDDSPPNNIDGSENSYEQIAMSGLDMPGLGPGADDLVSPSRKMTQKLSRQEPNQLYKFSRLWVQVAIPVCILLCMGIFLWSNLSIAASVIVDIEIPERSEGIIEFTARIPAKGQEALASEGLNSTALAMPAEGQWIPEGRVAAICAFTSKPMRCLGDAIVQSISSTLDENGIARNQGNLTDGRSVQFPIFNFNLQSAIEKMWQGKAYALAILIAVLSGAWPYIKLVSMFVLWFIPCRPSRRETILSVLEALGKWSLIDIYVFALMMAGFRFTLAVGAVALIRIALQAKWGIFAFCIGVLGSHFLSHLMMFIHHNAQSSFMRLPESRRQFSLSSVARIRHRKLNTCGQLSVALLILVALGFTFAGLLVPSFKFEFYGLLGMLLPQDAQKTEFTVVKAGVYIPSILPGLPTSTRVGEYFVVVVYYAFAVVTPILKVVSCLMLWSMPLTTRQKEVAKSVTSMLGTWSALDVFFVSVIAAIIEIGSLTSSFMGETCDSIKEALGIECLRLEARFLVAGCVCLAIAVISSLLVSQLILSSTSAHFRRVSMLHLWALKKKYFESVSKGKMAPHGSDVKRDREVMEMLSEDLRRNNFSKKFANLLAGSLHESHFDLDALSPADGKLTSPEEADLH